MARELPSIGTVTYNGYTFPEAFSCKIRGVPIYDSANRARKYVQYTITIDCIILPDDAPAATAGAQTDTNLADIRKRLQSPYKALTFTDQGFGTLTVDGAIVVDSRFGPQPRLLAWEPVGSNRACRIVWVCEVTIPECSSGTPRYHHSLAELTYNTSWNINESGMTVRTIRGTIEVPIAIPNGIVQDAIDNYRNSFNPPALPGFWRSQHYEDTRGHNILEITIIDTEIPSDNPYFPGTIRCDVRHRTESVLEEGFINWNNSLSGSFEAVAGTSRNVIWNLFRSLLQARLAKGRGHVVAVKGVGVANQTSWNLIKRVAVEESIYSRELNFEVSWTSIAIGWESFLERSGMFLPANDTNWDQWKTSLGNVISPRGIAGLKATQADDIIIDLCQIGSTPYNQDVTKPALAPQYSLLTNQCSEIPENRTYIGMDIKFDVIFDSNIVMHRKLSDVSISRYTSSQSEPNPSDTQFDPVTANDSMSISPNDSHKPQIRGAQTGFLVFSGKITRLCKEPAMPKVSKVGGKRAIQMGTPIYTPYVKVVSDTLPIYGLDFKIVYMLETMPEGNFFDTIETNMKTEHFSTNPKVARSITSR